MWPRWPQQFRSGCTSCLWRQHASMWQAQKNALQIQATNFSKHWWAHANSASTPRFHKVFCQCVVSGFTSYVNIGNLLLRLHNWNLIRLGMLPALAWLVLLGSVRVWCITDMFSSRLDISRFKLVTALLQIVSALIALSAHPSPLAAFGAKLPCVSFP